jgi:hypothetical protein
MRRSHATKREVEMSERKLLFMLRPEQAMAFVRLLEAAERGDGDAACRLGDIYREGLGGLRYSPKETYRWYAKSALAGDANGQNNLGACYEHGLGCVQSYAKAAKWYRLAAAQELGTAAMNLGYCYLRGHGVPRDTVEALRLFQLAVAGGEDRASSEVERLEEASGLRGLQLAPEDTGQSAAPGDCSASTPAGNASREPERSKVHLIRGIRFVDETQPGRHLGLVGGVPPPPPWEDEGLRLELLALLSAETVTPADGADGPTDEEVFPIFAEGGLKPDDLVDGIAERYAAYLARRPPTGEAQS